jgi:hypothetical protein
MIVWILATYDGDGHRNGIFQVLQLALIVYRHIDRGFGGKLRRKHEKLGIPRYATSETRVQSIQPEAGLTQGGTLCQSVAEGVPETDVFPKDQVVQLWGISVALKDGVLLGLWQVECEC